MKKLIFLSVFVLGSAVAISASAQTINLKSTVDLNMQKGTAGGGDFQKGTAGGGDFQKGTAGGGDFQKGTAGGGDFQKGTAGGGDLD